MSTGRSRLSIGLFLMNLLCLPLLASAENGTFARSVILADPAGLTAEPADIFTAAAADRDLIVLQTAVFDPVRHGPPDLSGIVVNHLKTKPLQYRYYIVQYHDRLGFEMQRDLRRRGAEIVHYVPHNALLVGMTASVAAEVQAQADVRWVGEMQPAYKLSLSLAVNLPNLAGDGDEHLLAVEFFSVDDMNRSLDGIAAEFAGDAHFTYIQGGSPTTVVLTVSAARAAECVRTLANLNEVKFIDTRPRDEALNNDSIWVCQSGDTVNKTTPVFDHNLLGQGQVIAVADSGLDKDHCAFIHEMGGAVIDSQTVMPPNPMSVNQTQRKLIAYNIMEFLGATDGDDAMSDWHGTHVSGSATGDDYHTPAASGDPGHDSGDGMAPLAKLIIQDGSHAGTRYMLFPYPFYDLWAQMQASGAHIGNASWGTDDNDYDLGSAKTDQYIYQNEDFLLCVAAGNSGPAPGSLNYLATAKNVLAVGATTNGAVGANGIVYYSSKGPARDGRLKPDLSAPGDNIISAWGAVQQNNCGLIRYGGTSMSSPTVAGLAALTRQYFTEGWYPSGAKTPADAFVPSAALLKAVLVNSCVNLTGGNTGQSGREDAPAMGQGWGRVTLDEALYFADKADARKLLVWDVANAQGVNTGGVMEFPVTVTAGEPLKATLAWSDPPGGTGAGLALVNDLDLEIVAPDNTVYRGNQWNNLTLDDQRESEPDPAGRDALNNLEGVLLRNPAAGNYLVRVIGYNVPGFALNFTQGFGLVVTGGVAVQNSVMINITSTTIQDPNSDGVIEPGDAIQLDVEIENTGLSSAGTTTATLSCSTEGVTVGTPNSNYGVLGGLSSATNTTPFMFSVASSMDPGTLLDFSLEIVPTNGNPVTRMFQLPVAPGSAPEISGLDIEEDQQNPDYPYYVDINLDVNYADPDLDIQYMWVLPEINGQRVNMLPARFPVFGDPFDLNTFFTKPAGLLQLIHVPVWQCQAATITGETYKMYLYVEDGAGNISNVIESNEITFTLADSADSPGDLNDDDAVYVEFPEGFVFPFYGEEYDGCYVNSDGNLTFQAGYSYMERNPMAHLRNMPRIAVLYTDLAKAPGDNKITTTGDATHFTVNYAWLGQWSQLGPVGVHTFSVTLFPDGAIEMNWSRASLTATQPDYLGVEWKCVVGLNPGAVAETYPETDLSQYLGDVAPIPLSQPIYEGFDENDAFDLVGQTLRFEPQDPTPGPAQTVYFPRLAFVPGVSTEGYGFVNTGDVAANVTFKAYDDQGALLAESPATPWPAQGQGAYQAEGLLGITEATAAWVVAESDQPGLLGFFLSQYFPEGFMAGLDGAEVGSTAVSDGVFPRIKGTGGYTTDIFLANTTDTEATVNFTGYDGSGMQAAGPLTIPPFGFVRTNLTELFGAKALFDGYILVESTAGLVGNAVIQKGEDSLSSVNLLPIASAAATLYAAHITVVPDVYYTEVNLINVGDTDATVTLSAIDEAGAPLADPFQVVVPAGQIVTRRDAELGLPTGESSNGWLKLESTSSSLMGCLTFGDPVNGLYESTLPLQAMGSGDVYFAQVANGLVGGVDYFTGVAVINSNDVPVDVTISVHMPDGSTNGDVAQITLQPGVKWVRLLQTAAEFGTLEDQSSGFLHITATGPVFAFQLFGNTMGDFLSAVPAQF